MHDARKRCSASHLFATCPPALRLLTHCLQAASAARCDFRSSYHTIYKLKQLVKDDKFVRLYFLLVADAEAIDEPQPQ